MDKRNDIPAIILGHGLTVLGTIRGLGRKKIRSFCHGPQQLMVVRSRWYNRFGPATLSDDESSLEQVLSHASCERGVLIACTDNWVRAVAQTPKSLRSRFPSSGPSLDVVDLLVDKRRFAEILDTHNVPHPLTIPLRSISDLEAVDLNGVESGFLKPVDSQSFGWHFKKKAFTFSGRDEARARFNEATAAGFTMILQEYIPGPPTEHYFLDGFIDRTGRIRGWFGRRRLRMYPPQFGNSSYLVSVPLEELRDGMESLERLLGALKYRGIFSAEFKRDPRDGRLKLLEVNARPWWQIGFAVNSGVNVAHMAYLDALEQPVPKSTEYRAGSHFVFPAYDGMACRELRNAGKITTWEWTRQWLTAQQAVLDWRDPMPSLKGWGIRIGRSAKRRLLGRPASSI